VAPGRAMQGESLLVSVKHIAKIEATCREGSTKKGWTALAKEMSAAERGGVCSKREP